MRDFFRLDSNKKEIERFKSEIRKRNLNKEEIEYEIKQWQINVQETYHNGSSAEVRKEFLAELKARQELLKELM